MKEEAKDAGALKKLLAGTATDKRSFVTFTEHELEYLREYVKLTEPIASGIDALQGDQQSFYGDLLPTLYSVKASLEDQFDLKILGNIAKLLHKSLIEKRFVNEFKLGEKAEMAICSAISHPAYKTKWGSVEDSEKALIIFKREFEKISNNFESDEIEIGQETTTSFIRLRTTAMTTEASEISRYLLSERVDLKMLNDFPVIREMFFKFNTQLPSSATAERMFNFAGILDDPKRNRIMPPTFEKNVLKANNVFERNMK